MSSITSRHGQQEELEAKAESQHTTSSPALLAYVDYQDPYVQPLILEALSARLPTSRFSYKIVNTPSSPAANSRAVLQILPYELLSFEEALYSTSGKFLINAYVYRKALIRKHFLANVVRIWKAKHPDSILGQHVPISCELEVDYAEFLDDAMVEAWELRESLNWGENEEESEEDEAEANKGKEWWVLKPGMSDGANGIRLFSTEHQLRSIFEAWDPPDSDDEDEDADESHGTGVMTSQLRHFVAQKYIHNPMLIESRRNCKFHIRTYVIAVGALKVYVYRPMLALFASSPYVPPWKTQRSTEGELDLSAHLTNTCFQASNNINTQIQPENVSLFWSLPDLSIPPGSADWKVSVFSQICSITGEVFHAALRSDSVNFQPIPCAFEVFGVDFLVDETGKTWLLEVNAFPDFKQTGDDLRDVVKGLWEEVVNVAIKPFFFPASSDNAGKDDTGRLVKVLDVETGR
jgi:tubulin---tyrosine ligase